MGAKKKNKRERLQEMTNERLLFADGYDDAIIGLDMGSGCKVVYDYADCIQCLRDEGLTEMEAYDHFHYNTLGSYIGDETPLYIWYLKEELND